MIGLRSHAAGSVLGRIVESKLREVEARAVAIPRHMLEHEAQPSDRSFLRALRPGPARNPRPALIAEIKRRSPSKGALREDLDAASIAHIYDRHAAAISAVTDTPFFGGSLALLREARSATTLPVMLKDFVLGEYQILEARTYGADAILLMASVLEPPAIERLLRFARTLALEALVEVHTHAELGAVLDTSAAIIGINNRDLATLAIDVEHFHRLAPAIDPARILVAESGLDARAALDRLAGKADAALIGTALMQAPDLEARIVELGW